MKRPILIWKATKVLALITLFGEISLAQAPSDEATILQQLGQKTGVCDDPDTAMLAGCAAKLGGIQGGTASPKDGPTPRPQVTAVPPFKQSDVHGSGPQGGPSSGAEPPTDFQHFVETSTGQQLLIYGASLFAGVPSTFAPVDHVPVTADYTIGPGDEIQLRVWGQVNFSQVLVVNRTGDIFVPQAGRVSVTGVPFGQLREVIRNALGMVYRNFELNVNMGQLRSVEVFVVGYARRPGVYTVSSLSTLVNALFASGGPSALGSMRKIQLRRRGKIVTTFDMYDFLLRGDKSKDTTIESGDVIFIPAHGAQVAIAGSVNMPAIYEVEPGTTLREMLDLADGITPLAGGGQAVLERVSADRMALESLTIALNAQGLETPLKNADIVRFLSVVPRFDKSVSLRGNVVDPVRLPWHAGMKISDLIPGREVLLTRDYWMEHNRLGEKKQFHEDIKRGAGPDSSVGSVTGAASSMEVREFESRNSVHPPAPEINWNYASILRTNKETLATRLIPFNLGKVVNDHDAAADMALEPGDVITIFSEADFVAPQAEQAKFVWLEGEIKSAGVYTVHPGETLRDLVARAGGLTNEAYLYGAQFSRESTRREQQKKLSAYVDQMQRDLDQGISSMVAHSATAGQDMSMRLSFEQQSQAIDRMRNLQASGRIVLDLDPEAHGVDALPAIALENADRLVVPSVPATVSVMGTVFNASSFLYNSSTAAGDYLREAGGPTRYADKNYMFILRADGSVISSASHGGMFKGRFESLRMFPGDALVVPSNVAKISKLRGFIDWSQVVSSFGIAAAAVNVLK